MRTPREAVFDLGWPSLRHAKGRLLGLPFVLAGGVPAFMFGWQACLASLMIAGLASFIVYIPMTALILNGGSALSEDAPVPALTVRAYSALFVLWAATAWLAAAAMAHLH